ncbi:hypothetical protein [Virgibacillus sp. DJP39]|uniref:hypothetical protein n=1 Tax=Virgibacillus sp. DJP39 TaxID=3409790 RepID=UPI003BB64631
MNDYEVFYIDGYDFERNNKKMKMFGENSNDILSEFMINEMDEKVMLQMCIKEINEFEEK